MVSDLDDLSRQHTALVTGMGMVAWGPRTCIEVTGTDRAQLLHSFCTQDIKRLVPGEGTEAFFTNGQGKTIGFAWIFCEPTALWLHTEPGLAEPLIRHLDRYVIREDVQFHDRSATLGFWLVAGSESTARLPTLLGSDAILPTNRYQGIHVAWQDHSLAIRKVDYAGSPTYLIETASVAFESVGNALRELGAIECTWDGLEMVRVEAGTPRFGLDLTAENLPQEIDRNAQAISFTKGCYLGQETVARIDALGHVNRLLRAVQFPGPAVPQVGSELHKDAKVVGRVTSAVWSIQLRAPLALAYVRREVAAIGTQLDSARIVDFPIQ